MVKCTGRGLVVKRPGVLSKVQMLNLVLGVGVFSPLPRSALEGALPVILYTKSNLESTLGSTPKSTPISESTLDSTRGALSEISLFSAL